MTQHGWIGVDLDGTLAHYDGWVSPAQIGAPIALMVDRVKKWLTEGQEVRIFTARVFGDGRAATVPHIEAWCAEHIGRILPITCTKDYGMIVLYDDRCVQVEANTGRVLGDGQ